MKKDRKIIPTWAQLKAICPICKVDMRFESLNDDILIRWFLVCPSCDEEYTLDQRDILHPKFNYNTRSK